MKYEEASFQLHSSNFTLFLRREKLKEMAKKKTVKKSIETLTHEEASRKNIPTAEFQSVMRKDEQDPIRVAYERRNRDLDPQLVWRGVSDQDN